MKKYLLANVAIFFAAAFVLTAAEATIEEPKIDIEADAKVSWGVDLGSGKGKTAEDRGVQHGFKNESSWKVKFPLIKKGDKTSAKSDMPVYGEVTLKDIELNIQSKHDKNDKKFALDGKVDKLEAKLHFYGAYLTVFNNPDFKTNYANLWDPIKTDDFKRDKMSYQFKPGFDGFGTKIGYANKNIMDLDVALKFGSNGNWEAKDTDPTTTRSIRDYDGKTKLGKGVWAEPLSTLDDNGRPVAGLKPVYSSGDTPPAGSYIVTMRKGKVEGRHSKYGIGLDFSMKPLDKMLGIKFNVNATLATTFDVFEGGKVKKGYASGLYTTHYEKSGAINVGTEVTSEPMDGLKLKFGFDGGSKLTTGNKDGSGKKIYGFLWDMLFDTQYKWIGGGVYVASAGTPYAGYNHQISDPSKLKTADMAVYLKFETKGDKKEASNLVEGLDAGAYVSMYNLLSKKNKDPAKDGNKVLEDIRPNESKETLDMLLKLWAAYRVNITDAMSIKPFATFWGETNHTNYGKGGDPAQYPKDVKPYFGIAYDLGVIYSPVEKVEVEAKWAHGTIGNNVYWTLIDKPVNNNTHNGTFTLSVKVKY
nr:MSP porin [uncultured Treponema sp.]